MIFNSREELYLWLNHNYKQDKLTMESLYVLVKYNGITEPLYFMHYENSYFESPCCLNYLGKEEDVEQYIRDIYDLRNYDFETILQYEKMLCVDGKHYEIDNPQCVPFLQMPCEVIKVINERETVEWLLKQEEV